MKNRMEPNFTNVTVNFLKNRRENASPMSRTPVINSQKANWDRQGDPINRGSVTKAAFPSYVGMTPTYDNVAFASTQASLSQSNKKANARAN